MIAIPHWVIDIADVVQAHAQHVAVGAGAVGALLALTLLWRFLRTGQVHEKLGQVAVTLATAFAMEGMYEVAHGPLDLNVAGSLMFCATFEVVMLHQGSLAAHKLAAAVDGHAPDISRHMKFVWLVSIASGVIASTASDSVTEVVLRLATPPLAAGIWYMSLYADKEPAERQPSRWIWTPQRIGVRLGLLKPGSVDDLTEVFRQRRIGALVNAGMDLYAEQQAARLRDEEPGKASRLRRRDPLAAALRRVQRLTKEADAGTVAAAREQLRRVLTIEHELFRDDTQPTERERELMDELRLIMRQATTTLRSDHARAFGPDQTRQEPLWSNDLVQMRSSMADQIRTTGPDQTAAPDRTSPVDQVATSRPVPAGRTRTVPRTTVRVDQVRPVSPAAGGELPPRVHAMAKQLRQAYEGDIPGRRVVMDQMGWTSAGDVQTAINLVRAERTKTTQ